MIDRPPFMIQGAKLQISWDTRVPLRCFSKGEGEIGIEIQPPSPVHLVFLRSSPRHAARSGSALLGVQILVPVLNNNLNVVSYIHHILIYYFKISSYFSFLSQLYA